MVEESQVIEMINDEDDRKALRELHVSGGHSNLNLDPGIDFPELCVSLMPVMLFFGISCSHFSQ